MKRFWTTETGKKKNSIILVKDNGATGTVRTVLLPNMTKTVTAD
jgi:hypothetical protein